MKREQNLAVKFKEALFSTLIAVLFFSPSAFAGLNNNKLILCKSKKVVRTLRVEVADDNKCHAIYTKQGIDATIGSGQYLNSCTQIVSNVRNNLEEAKWSCREVKEAKVSSLVVKTE